MSTLSSGKSAARRRSKRANELPTGRNPNAALQQRLVLESLEPRLVLSGTNAAISQASETALLDGLDGLIDWADNWETHQQTGAMLPVTGQPLGSSLDLSDVIDTGLVQPIQDFFNSDSDPFTDELVNVLENLSATLGNLTISVDDAEVSGGLVTYTAGSELVFQLVLDATRELTTGMGLGPKGDALGLNFGASAAVDLDLDLTLDFAFGMDLDSSLAAEDAFFVRVSQFSATADASATGMAGVELVAGSFDASVTGSMSLSAGMGVSLVNPDSDPRGNITLDELAQTSLDQLVVLSPSGSASGNLALSVGSFGGFTPTLSPTIAFSTNDPFGPVELSLTGFDELLPFTNMNATSVLGLFGQLGNWLNQLGGSEALDSNVQLVDGQSLGEILNLDGALAEGLLNQLLYGAGSPVEGLPKFDSVQSLATTLEDILGLTPGSIQAQYDDMAQELTYPISIDYSFNLFSLPLDFELDLDPVMLQSSGNVDVDVAAQLDFTVGIDLSRFRATVVAPLSGPANGQLSSDATLTLIVGGNFPRNVTVSQTATNDNSDLDDLVDDLNAALAAAGMADEVTAGRDAGNLSLFTNHVGPVVTLLVAADEENPAVTELGFDTSAFAFDTGLDDLFLEDASVSATAELSAPDVDLAAELGFVGLNVVDGDAAAEFSVSLELQDPATQTAGGRVYLDELVMAANSDITQVISGPNLTGSLAATFPLAGNILGLPTSGNPNVTVSWPDVFSGQPTIGFNNLDDLLNFEHLSEQQIFAALQNVGTSLQDTQAISHLAKKIPGIEDSLGKIFNYADRFLQVVAGFAADPAGKINELEAKLETTLGIDPAVLDLSLEENNTVLKIDATIDDSIMTQLPVNFDLGASLNNLIDLTGGVQLDAGAEISFGLVMGIDLTDPLAPRPFFYEDTGLTLEAKALGTGINFTAAYSTYGLFVQNGTFAIDADGSAATTEDAVTLHVGMTDSDAQTSSGKIYFDEFIAAVHTGSSFTGQARATLPLFYPTASQFKGNIELTITDLADIANTTTLTFPEQDMQEESDNFDLLNNLGASLDTVDYVMGVVSDAFHGEVFGVELPFLGKDFEKAGDALDDVRVGFLQDLRDRFQEANNETPEVARQAMFEALGPDGLQLLKDFNGDSLVTKDDITVTLTDTDADGDEDDRFQFDMVLEQDLGLLEESIAFDLGLPALGLEVDGNVEVALSFLWQLSFGVDRDEGVYIDTSPTDELQLGLRARIPDLVAEAEIGFLSVTARDEDADLNPQNVGLDVDQDGRLPSEFLMGVTIDLKDLPSSPADFGANQHLTFSELSKGNFQFTDLFDAGFEGTANLNLDLELNVPGGAMFPGILAELDVEVPFASTDPDLTGGVPIVRFDNVRLDVGDFVNNFAAPILETIQEFTEPAQPVIDVLTEPLPVVSDFGQEITLLDIASRVAEAYGYEFITDFIDAAADVVTLINSIPVIGGNVTIPLGSFDLLGTDIRQEEDLTNVQPNVTQTVDPIAELQMADAEAKGFYDAMHDMGIFLPIIEDPSQLFSVLMGRQADLVGYDMPALKFGFPFPPILIGPVVPPIPAFVDISIFVGAEIDFAFGFDTRGWLIYEETGDFLDIAAGFYISDTKAVDGSGEDVPEITLTGRVDVSLDVTIFVLSAGAGGGVTFAIGADLADPDGDGRIHHDELLDNIERGVTCTFDLHGEAFIEMFTFVQIVGARFEYRSPRIQLLDFELSDSDCYPDRFTNNNSLMTATDLGIAPGLHVEGLSLETTGDQDWYQFELLKPDDIDVNVRHSHARGNLDLAVYNATGQLMGAGNSDKDGEIVRLQNLQAGIYYAQVTGSADLNNYKLIVEPGKKSKTRVHYVSQPDDHNEDVSYVTWAAGRDAFDGLSAGQPKATLQSVLDSYDLGPNDLIRVESGSYPGAAAIASEDNGVTVVGSVAGSTLGALTLQQVENTSFVQIGFSDGSVAARGNNTVLVALDQAHGNLFDRVSFHSALTNVELLDAANNRFADSWFSGSGDGVVIDGPGASGNVLVDSTLQNEGTAVWIRTAAANLMESNIISGPGVIGVNLEPVVRATIRENEITGRNVGLYTDSKVANVHSNLVHDNVVGISSRQGVICFTGCGWISTDATTPNQIYSNETGILVPADGAGVLVGLTDVYNNHIGIEVLGDNTRLLANQIFGNDVGVQGTGTIGPQNWQLDLSNHIRGNIVGVRTLEGANVQFNRIYENGTGIEIVSSSTTHHNLLYRNSDDGILVKGALAADVFNNTVVAPSGNAARIEGAVADVSVYNNIFWTDSGTALYVEPESEFGLSSDHNNLYAASAGSVAFRGKAFSDLFDWQVETNWDQRSLGSTSLGPTRDDPRFADMDSDDYRLLAGSTSIDAGRLADSFDSEPGVNGDRRNLGAYGNTLLATASPAEWLSIVVPEFYEIVIEDQLHTVHWETFNVASSVDIDVELVEEVSGNAMAIATVPVTDRSVSWRPSDLGIAGDLSKRYRVRLTTDSGPLLVEQSREPFAIVEHQMAAANTFYVDDSSNSNDEYTTEAIGNNRHTGQTALDPLPVIRSVALWYQLGPQDVVKVDSGSYVHAINLNLRQTPTNLDPRLETVTDTLVTGPTNLALPRPVIDRANSFPGATAIDIHDAANMALHNLEIVGGHIGVRASQGSTNLTVTQLSLHDHSSRGISIETASHDASLDNVDAYLNGQTGIYVDSLLDFITNSQVYENGEIGLALRNVGAGLVETSHIYSNGVRGVDILNSMAGRAIIGHETLANLRGNLIYENGVEGVFAAGNVNIAGNTLWQNNDFGIRLAGGADALRNIAYEHERGISARESSSDIIENRSFLNTHTGIEAGYFSNVLRNVTYSNDIEGFRGDHFGGLVLNNVIYQTGQASAHIEGPGEGARFINNTVYETCAVNDDLPHSGPTPVMFEWDWQISMDPPPFPPPPIPPFNQLLWGEASFLYSEPVGLTSGGTFNLGPGGSVDALSDESVPIGEVFQIDFVVNSFEQSSEMFPPVPDLGHIYAALSGNQPSAGTLLVENVGGVLVGSVNLDLYVEFTFSESPAMLVPDGPMSVSQSFGMAEGFGAFEVLQIAGDIPLDAGRPPAALMNLMDPTNPWFWELDSGDAKPVEVPVEPHRGETCAEIGVLVDGQSRNVSWRNNVIYVEGDGTGGQPNQSVNIVVAADSTDGLAGDHNLIYKVYGLTGTYAGNPAPNIGNWQALSGIDDYSEDVDPQFVDPDGADNLQGGFNGYDDDLHVFSGFGHASGALAPRQDPASQLPVFDTVSFTVLPGAMVSGVSPAVDFGDPSFAFGAESPENGQIINAGGYGGTIHASLTPTEFTTIIQPRGLNQWIRGSTYEIDWRSDGMSSVTIELLRGGNVETVIAFNEANDGSYFWTVPGNLPDDTTYEIRIRRAPLILIGEPEIVGQSQLPFEIKGADTRPPQVIGVSPNVLDTMLPATVYPANRQLPTNQPMSQFTVTFSENLVAGTANLTANYELRSAGPAGSTAFGDGDDVVYALTATYTTGTHDGDISRVDLDLLPGVTLPDGLYRLRMLTGLVDVAGNALDGDGDGTGGDAFEQFFAIDTATPTVAITPVSPDPTNQAFDSINIVFSEAALDLDLSDLSLSLGDPNGPNQLTGDHTLSTTDSMTWTLGNLTQLMGTEGNWYLTLDHADADITDLAGNALLSGATDDWEMDYTAPKLVFTAVAPDPRNTAITSLELVESEPIFDFLLTDLVFTRDRTPITGVLANITGTEGIYYISFVQNAALHDLAGNTMDVIPYEVWQVYTSAPEGLIVPVAPDPRNQTLNQVEINFTRQVTGVDIGDFMLSRDGSNNLLTGSETLFTMDNIHYTISGLSALTGLAGDYHLTLQSASSDIEDLAGNPIAATVATTWIMETSAPQLVALGPVAPDPRNTVVDDVTIEFSEAVFGLTLGQLLLTYDDGSGASANLLTTAQTLTTSDGRLWTLGNLSALTALEGTYQLTLSPAGIVDSAGNALPAGGAESWVTDQTAPSLTITDVAIDPRVTPLSEMVATFTETVAGVELADFTLTRNGGANLLGGAQSLTTTDNITFTLENLEALTSLPGLYELSLIAFGSGITDLAGNALPVGTFETFLVVADPDFDTDGDLDVDDIDALVAAIAGGLHNPLFDLTGDGLVDLQDRDQWLALAGAMNLQSGNAYLLGDANLDGTVDGQDFLAWNSNKFSQTAAWTDADFNADGVTDGQDFLIWNAHKFMSADSSAVRTKALDEIFEEDELEWDREATTFRKSQNANGREPYR